MEKYCTCFVQTETTIFQFNELFSRVSLFLEVFKVCSSSLRKTIEFECAASWCTWSVRLGKDTCVPSVTACLGAADTALLVITHTQQTFTLCPTWCLCVGGWVGVRDGGLWGGCLWLTWLWKTAPGIAPRGNRDCGIFMKNLPVVPASVTRRLWIRPSYGRLPRRRGKEGEREEHFKEGKGGMEGDWWWRGDRLMQLSCHVRFMIVIIDVSILVVITVRVFAMF